MNKAAMAQADPRNARPQEGDRFVFAGGDRKGAVVTTGDLPLGGPQNIAYPQDPRSAIVRDGARLNPVLLIRFESAGLTEATPSRSPPGIVAYSAVCAHAGGDE